jgi:hypothetical protein
MDLTINKGLDSQGLGKIWLNEKFVPQKGRG